MTWGKRIGKALLPMLKITILALVIYTIASVAVPNRIIVQVTQIIWVLTAVAYSLLTVLLLIIGLIYHQKTQNKTERMGENE